MRHHMGVTVADEALVRVETCLNEIKNELTMIRGEIDTKVAESTGRYRELELQITANRELADERNRSVWHQFNNQRRANAAIITTIVIAWAALAAEMFFLKN